jgi:YihY family inner membrane protein
MSSATPVPETWGLDSDAALVTLRRHGGWLLVRESFTRFRYADGFSHARALAFQMVQAFIPGVVAVEGFASVFHHNDIGRVAEQTLRLLTPGAADTLLHTASVQGEAVTGRGAGGIIALVLGLVAALVSVVTAMGQIERGANRIYGVEQDRPGLRKYALATALGLVAGTLAIGALVLLVAGAAIGRSIGHVVGWGTGVRVAWEIGRWPLGVALAVAAFAILFERSPRRRQPSASWLAFGSAVSVALWLIFTAALALYVDKSGNFGTTYGPLTGVLALVLWCLLSSIALFLGLAFAAQLEAVRAGLQEPVDEEKAEGQVAADDDHSEDEDGDRDHSQGNERVLPV